ncbi:MAG: hypothetical protein GEV04_24760, partial [Actinophytocola sp.]|nr:hypothetical protein [Actinophytocola sp.]
RAPQQPGNDPSRRPLHVRAAVRRRDPRRCLLAPVADGGLRGLARRQPRARRDQAYSRSAEKRRTCVADLRAQLQEHACTVRTADSTADACAGADVICTATSSAVPVLDSEHVAAGPTSTRPDRTAWPGWRSRRACSSAPPSSSTPASRRSAKPVTCSRSWRGAASTGASCPNSARSSQGAGSR